MTFASQAIAPRPALAQLGVDAGGQGTSVTLTFDDGTISQYELAYRRALEPRGLAGTFYVVTGHTDRFPGFMTWAQLLEMNANGQEIAGHTLDHINLTDPQYPYDQKVHEVCDDRQNLLDHGLRASSFAYPEGAYDATAEQIVAGCGYSTARASGGLSGSVGPYAETIPPTDPFATRTQSLDAPGTLRLQDVEAIVISAALHGGGWATVPFHRVCSQVYLPAEYADCLGSFHPIELDTLNVFLDWLSNPGTTGHAPAGVSLATVDHLAPPDTTPPTTAISCNSLPCSSGWYASAPVSVTLSAVDNQGGSGVASTHYTIDGTDPTDASPTYSAPFDIGSTTTVKFRSWDNAGNSEDVVTQLIQIDAAPPDVTISQPADGSSFSRGARVKIAATAFDLGSGGGSPSGVRDVVFYLDGSAVLGLDPAAPYRITWRITRSVLPGTHALTAVATDEAGNSTMSEPVMITVTA
jgi:peptidoglycan/xylan/chitin deacetylase (PgdA/CDA1 family)